MVIMIKKNAYNFCSNKIVFYLLYNLVRYNLVYIVIILFSSYKLRKNSPEIIKRLIPDT